MQNVHMQHLLSKPPRQHSAFLVKMDMELWVAALKTYGTEMFEWDLTVETDDKSTQGNAVWLTQAPFGRVSLCLPAEQRGIVMFCSLLNSTHVLLPAQLEQKSRAWVTLWDCPQSNLISVDGLRLIGCQVVLQCKSTLKCLRKSLLSWVDKTVIYILKAAKLLSR